MKFDLVRPCAECPFRSNIKPFLRSIRVREILNAIINHDDSFVCHKTVEYDSDDDGRETPDTQHCAGAMILLEHIARPNQMMRIAERVGLYDHTKLDMNSPVYDDPNAMLRAAMEMEMDHK